MHNIGIKYFKTAYGELVLGVFGDRLCLCDWRYRNMRERIDTRLKKYLKADFILQENAVLDEAANQLNEYFNYRRQCFDMPLLPVGTEFQKKVWRALIKISYGSVCSYQKLAENLGDTKAVRAVAGANGANAISVFIPCHRIIGSDGTLTGYAGGLKTKEKLLKLENSLFSV